MLQHVTRELPPAQLKRSIEFYELLGFNRVSAPPGIRGRAVWLERRATQIHLMPRDDAHPQSGHIGLVLDDYESTLAALRSAGYEVEPRQPHWGASRAYVRDPAGNLVELMAFPPGDQPPQA